mgnify:CR=1 FL=1
MLCLREHVQRLKKYQAVALFHQKTDIPGLRGRVAGNIDNIRYAHFAKHSESFRRQTGAGRVQNGQIERLLTLMMAFEDILQIRTDKVCVGNVMT